MAAESFTEEPRGHNPGQGNPPILFKSLNRTKRLWNTVKTVRSKLDEFDSESPGVTPRISDEKEGETSRSTLAAKKRIPAANKMKMEVDRLWETGQTLMKKEGRITEGDIEKLRKLIQEAVDLSGRIRLLVREKETYTDEDVVSHAKDINNLQLLLHAVVEVWTKVESPEKEKHASSVMSDLMELGTDICSVYGEVMAIFLQRFGLDIVPLLRPVHGLFYSISIHCRYHCPELPEDDVTEMKSLYNSFLSSLFGLMKSTKVLLKRLRFDQDIVANRRRTVQTSISSVMETMHAIVKDGRMCSAAEYVETIEKVGSLCTDIFFVIGKTSGVAEVLEMGEGVMAMGPAEFLGEVAHSDIQRCPIERRPLFLKGMEIDEGGTFISDIFLQSGSLFNPTQKVTIRMPYSGMAIPPGGVLKVKLKLGDQWMDAPGKLVNNSPVEEREVAFLPDGVTRVSLKTEVPTHKVGKIKAVEEVIEFESQYNTGFVAVMEYDTVVRPLTPTGFCYVCPDDDRVRVNFPERCVSKATSLGFKLIQINRNRMFDYKDQCPNLCRSIMAVSDCLKVDHDNDVVFEQPVTVHLPLPNDIDDPDSEIVIFRSRDRGDVELIPKRTAMLCPSALNCYTFQVQSFSGIAIGKVKTKGLRKNRSAVVSEYELYTEAAYICNILTFMDKSLLHVGMVKFVIEIVERRFMKKALRRRAKEGLFEIPGSRSENLRLENEDIICIETDGNIQRMREVPLETYFIVFLSSARDNFRTFPVEQRKDPDNRSYGILNFFKDNEEDPAFLHTANIDANKYLVGVLDRSKSSQTARGNVMTPRSLGGSWTSSRQGSRSARETTAYRAVFDEIPVLSHQSLLALCTYLRNETVHDVSYELGVPYDYVMEQKTSGQPAVMINFNILWKWRGAKPNRDMVQFLIRSFRICGHPDIAEKIMVAGNNKRPLTKDDFMVST